jgi:hypothetical protein
VKRHELLWGIARAARAQGVVWQLHRQGASHEIWRCDGLKVISRKLEGVLGKDWWRR